MKLIRLLLRTSWVIAILAAIAGILSGASAAGLIASINATVSQSHPSTTALVWGFAGLCLLRIVTSFASQVLLIRIAQKAVFEMRMLLSRQILASPLRQLEEIGAPRLLSALTDDVQSVSSSVFQIPFLCINFAVVAGCLIYLCWLSWTVFLAMVGVLILGAFSYQLSIGKAMSFWKMAREEENRLFEHFRAITEGIKELKLHSQRRQAFLSEELELTGQSYQRYNILGMMVFSAGASWGQSLFFVAIGLLLFLLPALQKIETPVLSGYALTIIYLMNPLEYIGIMLPNFGRAAVALKNIESLGLSLSNQAIEGGAIAPISPLVSCQRVELSGVTHAYRGDRDESSFTVGPIDLTFQPGELVFIVGGNGSGKSTLVKLIAGLYVPESGEIRVDGQAIDAGNREWYRQLFSVVFSDFFLFDRLLGLDASALDAQTKDYLIQLQLDRKVTVENGVLSTTALSQGQRKRLALLTAYLEDRPIYIFDEWASDQDPIFKEIFYRQLLPELRNRGKMVIAISHDNRYFHGGDRIVKLDYGKVEYDKHLHS